MKFVKFVITYGIRYNIHYCLELIWMRATAGPPHPRPAPTGHGPQRVPDSDRHSERRQLEVDTPSSSSRLSRRGFHGAI